MNGAVLTQTRLRAGVWEGVLADADAAPKIEVTHQGVAIPGVTVLPLADPPGSFAVRIPVPVALLSDGVQTFLIRDGTGGETLAHFTILSGAPLDEDIRAEVDLLRAELDMLKRAFRRHCLETAG